ncbi:MAG: methyltransferase domain-containing protein [Nakamurella sp.]
MAKTTYTHGHHESVLRSHRSRTAENSAGYLFPQLRPGLSLLDIGSGPGTITADLAELVAPARVTAVENTDAAMDLTRAEIAARGLHTVDFLTTDVHRMDLPDDSFDVVHAHQVLQHVGDPVQAFREMGRVCRPGGVVAVRDADYAGFIWFPESPLLDRWLALYREAALANGGQPDAGRRLLSWAHQAGFTDETVSVSSWCYATPEARAGWGGMWADRMLQSDLARQLVDSGAATPQDLQQISAAWRAWAADQDGWFQVPHGEILIRIPSAG